MVSCDNLRGLAAARIPPSFRLNTAVATPAELVVANRNLDLRTAAIRLVEARAYLVRCCGVGLPQLCECCAAAAAKAHCGALCAARLHRSGPAGSWC